MKILVILSLLISFSTFSQEDKFLGETITFPSTDGIEITADLYNKVETSDTYIILFHQANFSRGSYRPIAPKLNELGFNCIAIDQRSGFRARGVVNQTNKKAKAQHLNTKYIDAVPDLEATILYVKNELKAKKIILWGSSYSASLVLYMGTKHPKLIDAILSFSPGEYFEIDGNTIESFVGDIKCPVFISSSKNEHKQWKSIFDKIQSEKVSFLPKESGFHGSKALWFDKKGNEEYWNAVTEALKVL